MESKVELQSHQLWVIGTIQRLILSGRTRIAATCPLGIGHTVIIAKVMSDFEKGRALFVTSRRELAMQFMDKANGFGFDIGLCVAGKDQPDCACVCGTIQTLITRGVVGDFNLVVIDDDILSREVMFKKLLKSLSKDAVLVSLHRYGDNSDREAVEFHNWKNTNK